MQRSLEGSVLFVGALLATPLWSAPGTSDLPAFQPGLWEYQRTVTTAANPRPQHSSLKKCSDPSREIQQKLADLQHKGCQFSPVTVRGNQYLSTWRCPASSGQLVDRNVVTVISFTSYQDDNEVRSGEHVSRSTVIARRVGECPDQGATQSPSGTTLDPELPAKRTR
jgi:hypothetical protein